MFGTSEERNRVKKLVGLSWRNYFLYLLHFYWIILYGQDKVVFELSTNFFENQLRIEVKSKNIPNFLFLSSNFVSSQVDDN